MAEFLWQSKEAGELDAAILEFLAGDDVELDRELFVHDIHATRAHVRGLQRIGLLALDDGKFDKADEAAYRAMVLAARALVRTRFLSLATDDPARVIEEFRKHFYDTKLFFDPFAGGKFAHYLFDRHNNPPATPAGRSVRPERIHPAIPYGPPRISPSLHHPLSYAPRGPIVQRIERVPPKD